MSNATLNIRINDKLTFTSQANFRTRTSLKAKTAMQHYITERFGMDPNARNNKFEYEVIEGVQYSATQGRSIVKAKYRECITKPARYAYFVLSYDANSRFGEHDTIIAVFSNLEDARNTNKYFF